MKPLHPELLVHLDEKLARVLNHWASVDDALPPAFPIVLLENMDREAAHHLAEELPVVRVAERAAIVELKIVRGRYELRKREIHAWLKAFRNWLRACFGRTEWLEIAPLMPGRGQAYQFWWDAALDAIHLWQRIEKEADVSGDWRQWVPRGGPVQRFEQDLHAFETAWLNLSQAELELKLARGRRRLMERRATELLMAYGHGVCGRLLEKNPLRENLPQLWPSHRKRKNHPPVSAGAAGLVEQKD